MGVVGHPVEPPSWRLTFGGPLNFDSFYNKTPDLAEPFKVVKYATDVTAQKLRAVFTLRALGVPDDKLQITYVKEIKVFNEAHMVLAYFATPDAEPVILDNINKTIQPASNRGDLVPVYSFNGSGLWLAKQQQGRGQSAGSSDRIGHWKDLQNRMKGAT